VKSFTVLLGGGNRVTLGRYPQLSLQQAREEAKRRLAEKTLGHTKVKNRAKPSQHAINSFLADCSSRLRPKTVENYALSLRQLHIEGDLEKITQTKLVRSLNKLTPSNKEHAIRVGKTFFTWCMREGLLDSNPIALLKAPVGQARERILTDQELAEIYRAAISSDESFCRLMVFLIRTGQRRGESSLLQREWIDRDQGVIVFPSSVTKNKRVHNLPYLPQWGYTDGDRGLVFPGVGGVPLAGWSKLKPKFDQTHGVRDYTLHDLRRTFSSGLARLSIPIHVTEKILNHVSGTHSGVQAIYNRYSYQDEMHEALLRWQEHLDSLIAPKG
jgi:integrase